MAYRKEKVEELIRRIVSEALIKEVQDPRIGFVTITEVRVSKDFAHADVLVSIMGTGKEFRNAMAGLKSSQGYIQKIVNKNLRMRQVPRINFKFDSSIADGVRMVEVLENLEGVDSPDKDSDRDDE